MDPIRNLAPWAAVLVGLIIAVIMLRRQIRPAQTRQPVANDKVLDQRAKLQRAMEQLQINIMEFGRDVESRLDTKIAVLTQLIRDADERIKRLEGLSKSGRSHGPNDLPPLHKEVYRLADEGLDKLEIARRTSTTPGEVELILGLRKQRNA